MQVTIDQTIPNIEPDQAQAWWSSFQPGSHDHAFIPGARRPLDPQPDASTRIHGRSR